MDILQRKGVRGYKCAITQQDSNVRLSHTINALDGWIAHDETFSGTGHMLPPFGFLCRCTVKRKIYEPTEEEWRKVLPTNAFLEGVVETHRSEIERIY